MNWPTILMILIQQTCPGGMFCVRLDGLKALGTIVGDFFIKFFSSKTDPGNMIQRRENGALRRSVRGGLELHYGVALAQIQ